jgi:hypothetical protein
MMRQLLFKLKQSIRDWLRVPSKSEVTILEAELRRLKTYTTSALLDVQYHQHGETQIVIASRLGKGFVKIIDIQLKDLQELRGLVSSIENRYRPGKYIVDAPCVAKELLKRDNPKCF